MSSWFYYITVFLLVAGSCCILYYIAKFMMINRQITDEVNAMEVGYRAMEDRIQEVRKRRHDLAKHIQMIEYLMEKDADLLTLFCAMKREECDKKDIPLYVEVKNSIVNDENAPDMIALLQNLMDNAIESCQKIPQDEPCAVWLKVNGGEIEVSNRYKKGQTITFETEKEDKEKHGFGMKNIQEIVEAYQGTLDIVNDDENSIIHVYVHHLASARSTT